MQSFEMNEDNLSKLQVMLNKKYIELIMPELANTLTEIQKGSENYATALFKSNIFNYWKEWKECHKITDDEPEENKNYIKVIKAANSKTLFVPIEFAKKAIILGFLP